MVGRVTAHLHGWVDIVLLRGICLAPDTILGATIRVDASILQDMVGIVLQVVLRDILGGADKTPV
jgi:hypothetical protein